MKKIPESYKEKGFRQGQIEEVRYDTWDNLNYEREETKIHKKALVYVPYGYDDTKAYNIFYLMHGGWRTEETLLRGEPGPSLPPWVHQQPPKYFKNVLDHAMEEGVIRPMIIVCPTFNNLHNTDSGDYNLAVRLTAGFYREFLNDLVPSVETRYHTFAEETTIKGLRKSREHRGFGGYSMGGVCTWQIMAHCIDIVKYFMPMSSGSTGTANAILQEIKDGGWNMNSFEVYAATGKKDFAYEGFDQEVKDFQAKERAYYHAEPTNIHYELSEDGVHDLDHAHEYTYNLLQEIWK